MMIKQKNYFEYLTHQLVTLLNGVIREKEFGLFKKPLNVTAIPPKFGSEGLLHLVCRSKSFGETDNSATFHCEMPNEKFLVFRKPVRLFSQFALIGTSIPANSRLRAEDKLFEYFFDHKSIAPFVPDFYRQYPTLYHRLADSKASLKLKTCGQALEISSGAPFYLEFDYTALYHSGNPLREEQKTRQRIIHYHNHNNNPIRKGV